MCTTPALGQGSFPFLWGSPMSFPSAWQHTGIHHGLPGQNIFCLVTNFSSLSKGSYFLRQEGLQYWEGLNKERHRQILSMSFSGTAWLNLLIIITTSSPEEEHFPKSLKKHQEGKDLTEKLYHEMHCKCHSLQPMPVVLANKQWTLKIQFFCILLLK